MFSTWAAVLAAVDAVLAAVAVVPVSMQADTDEPLTPEDMARNLAQFRATLIEELSEQLGVTKSHLVRVFKQEMGVPPGKYMTNVRIEAVKTLLLTDEYNLDMIAGLTGFSGANYLCRVFKREVGLSPAAWRTAAAPLPAVPKLPPRSQEMYV